MNVKNVTAKSSLEQLTKRGYIDYLQFDYEHVSIDTYLSMLCSHKATYRSLAARGLRSHILKKKVVDALLIALQKEKALYTKIEITDTLKFGNKKTLEEMLPYLGIIGNNQHTVLPNKVSKKKTYPLPRDIIARTIAHMNPILLPFLIEQLNTSSLKQVRELVDAIGFMAYRNQKKSAKLFVPLLTYYENCNDLIVRWKLVTCFSAFLPFSKDYLIYLSKEDSLLNKEAKRSLSFE
ncbi:MAG: hypothetical protein PHQ89_03820 [Bacilli bacterium]|nr:hypothetical protein [Bacilli bacterium]